MKIEIEDNKFIEFDEAQRLLFYGQNQKIAQKLIRSLKRFANKKSLNSLEELVYGENGIEIYRDKQLINAKQIDIYFLQDNFSLYKEVSFAKDSLMTTFLSTMSDNVDINMEIENIKDHMLKIEILLNKQLGKISNNVLSNISDLSYTDILKSHLFLSYIAEKHNFPLEMMDANELVDEYLALLKEKLKNQPKETWIVLVNPTSFLTMKSIQVLLDGLSNLARETGKVNTFVFSQLPLELVYELDDIPSTVILTDEVCQMPDFESFRKSIENHYPSELNLTNKELCQNFYEIVANIGSQTKVTGKSYRSIVLLKVINEILGFASGNLSMDIKNLNELELNYLTS